MNLYTATGRVIEARTPAFKTEKTAFEVVLSVPTGQRKREEEEYPPSMIVKFIIWDRFAEVMKDKIAKGDRILVSGKPTIESYTTDSGEVRTNLNLFQVDSLDVFSEGDSASQPQSATKKTSTKKKPKSDIPDWEPLDDDEDLFA